MATTDTEVAPAPAARLPALDGLRGAAALWVLVYHCWIRTGAGPLDGLGPLAAPIRTGTLGVEVFFVLSGFVLVLRLERAPMATRAFVAQRLVRLLPAVWIALGVAVATAGWHQASTAALERSLTPESVVANLTLLAGVARLVPGYEGAVGFVVDPVVWSLTPELLFSLALAPLLPLLRRGPVPAIGLLLVAGVVLRAVDPGARWLSVASPLLTAFPLGVATAFALARRGAPGAGEARLLIGGGAALLLAGVFAQPGGGAAAIREAFATSPGWPVLVAVACAALCLGLAGARTLAGAVLASRPAVALGRWSYGIYLWHFPIIGVLVWSAGVPADGTGRSLALAVALATPLAVVAGAASHRFVEQPAQRLVRGRRASPAAPEPSSSRTG